MLKKILVVLVVFIIAFVVVVSMQPSHYSVVRTGTITAPAPVVFAQVNDFHKWEAWSPWAKMDPAAKNSFEGAASGTGAVFAWAGNSKVGEGRMTILESRPNELIRIKLDFQKPFESTCDVEFTFKPQGDQTIVMWSMSGEKNFVSKGFCLFKSMDKMIGAEFEKGLASMKTAAESAPKN